jgi:adenylate kinase family enzyme
MVYYNTKMVNYYNSLIYRIFPCVDGADDVDVYFGSTTLTLSNRMAVHRSRYRQKHTNQCKVSAIFEKYGLENCKIELVEAFPCENRNELNKREGFYIRSFPCLNKNISGRMRTEYYLDNRERLLNYQTLFNERNKESISEYKRLYNINNRDKRREYAREAYRRKNPIIYEDELA